MPSTGAASGLHTDGLTEAGRLELTISLPLSVTKLGGRKRVIVPDGAPAWSQPGTRVQRPCQSPPLGRARSRVASTAQITELARVEWIAQRGAPLGRTGNTSSTRRRQRRVRLPPKSEPEAKAIGCHLVATFVRRPEPSRYGRYAAGRIFWFTRNRFAGS